MIDLQKKIIVLITLYILAVSCVNTRKAIECPNSQEAKLINMKGLDGCSWMIELENGNKLNPINLDDFNVELIDNKKLMIGYTVKNDKSGICMAGEIIEINCITEVANKQFVLVKLTVNYIYKTQVTRSKQKVDEDKNTDEIENIIKEQNTVVKKHKEERQYKGMFSYVAKTN